MKAPTKKALNSKMVMYRDLASKRQQCIHAAKDLNDEMKIEMTDLKKEITKLKADELISKLPVDPWQSQHGGSHYAELTIQPLQYTLGSLGYEAFKGACHNHVARYTTRKKDNEVTQLKKARHILDLWIYEAEKQLNSEGE